MAVYGRPVLSAGEMRRMLTAENIKNAYLSRKASTNWGKWAQDNPAANELLINVEMIINADRPD